LTYEELHRRYGTHVSQRIRRELAPSDFETLQIDALPEWLESRAETAHENYLRLLTNPVLADKKVCDTGIACRRWREAEDLAYLIAIAEDVGTQPRRIKA
jgi:hypothetical protein